jgi:hypothetical protein
MLVESLVSPDAFLRRPLLYHRPDRILYRAFLRAHNDAYFDALAWKKLLALSSFYSSNLHLRHGEKVKRTVDYLTSPGVVQLVNQDRLQAKADYARLKDLEFQVFRSSASDAS